METLSAPKEKVQQIYRDGDSSVKNILTRLFGGVHLMTTGEWERYAKERIKSFEDACRETGQDPDDPYFSAARPHENAIRKIETWALALNQGKVLSYADASTEKWRVWVVYDEEISGFRLYDVGYDDSCTDAGLGSRTAFASRKLAEHFAEYAMPLINESLS